MSSEQIDALRRQFPADGTMRIYLRFPSWRAGWRYAETEDWLAAIANAVVQELWEDGCWELGWMDAATVTRVLTRDTLTPDNRAAAKRAPRNW